MRPRIAYLLIVWFLLLTPASAVGQQEKVNVYVDHTGNDPVGQRLAFALREAIRASRGYELASLPQCLFQVSLVTMDPEDSPSRAGKSTVVCLIITMKNLLPLQEQNPQTWYPIFLDGNVLMCGIRKVDELAQGILAALDAAVERFRAAAHKQ
jgi:hypothetical protein